MSIALMLKKIVRKEMKVARDHEAELENLSILNHLKHPNIVEVLTSYTRKDRHNLIFPLAEGGTLDDLLSTERNLTPFISNESFLVGLVGLSSALDHVHNFITKCNIKLELIGCHHDLRPKNILLSGQVFILADFGLSKFKPSTEDSATPFKKGQDYYLAPECEDLDKYFEPLSIRRSSDIWSFGCN